jgi:uncharacterized hydrophobic protein (TIGR00271 family)
MNMKGGAMRDTNAKWVKPPWFQRIFLTFPKLERGDRLELQRRIELGAQGGVDYIVMIVLSGSLASLGLLEGSTAVIIGAMLVAPLMGPPIGAGLALVQGNLFLFRRALGVTLLGIGIGLTVSLFFGLLNPGFEPSVEIEARGIPDLFDLIIALVSGMAAAYASGRPNVAGTLAGVAIAAALVPPLAVTGIALVNGHPFIAGNATILLITNLVAIILGAAIIFRLFGVQESVRKAGAPSWVRKAFVTLLLVTIILMAPLLIHIIEKERKGQDRPLNYPAAPRIREAVKAYMNGWPSVELIAISRTSVEPEAGITIILSTTDKITQAFEQGLRRTVMRARGEKTGVRIFSLLSARSDLLGE